MSRWSWILLLLSSVFLASCTTHRVTHYARETPDEFPVLRSVGYGIVDVQPGPTRSEKILQAIRASRLDAYRELTEQVYGQQLDASTTVADMTVMSDTFRAKVEGVIYGAVLVSITPVGEDTYETTLSLDQQVVRDLRALYLNQLAARRR